VSSSSGRYRSTESKYRRAAEDMFVVYDLKQRMRSGAGALYPKVKRVHIAGDVEKVTNGLKRKRSGRKVRGVRIEYLHTRKGYRRDPSWSTGTLSRTWSSHARSAPLSSD